MIGDWETTGIPDPYNLEPYSTGPQGIQFAAAFVTDIYSSWEIVDEFTMTLRWLGPDENVPEPELPGLTWDEKAYQIHRMSKTFLRDKPTPEEMASPFSKFIFKNVSRGSPILFGGHNPQFDQYFNHQFMLMSGLVNETDIRFHHRMLDSFTAGFFKTGMTNSDDLFKLAGCPTRTSHNAMEDVRHTVRALRFITRELGGIPIP